MAETIVVLAIVAVITAIAVPQVITLINKYRLTGAARLVWADLQQARMTAIKENSDVRVVFTSIQINPTLFTSSYNFIRVNTGETIFTRSLRSEYPTITAEKTNGDNITFYATGMTSTNYNENYTVIVQGPMGSKSIGIKGSGRITLI
jgi:Tfp pilus assembly protein FimT